MAYEKRIIVDFDGLKEMGVPWGRTQIGRKEKKYVKRSKGSPHKGTRIEWEELNPDPFPHHIKLGPYKNSPKVWIVAEVLAYLESHGIKVPENWRA